MEFIVFWVSVGPLTATNDARVRIIIDRDYLREEEQSEIGEGRREERRVNCARNGRSRNRASVGRSFPL